MKKTIKAREAFKVEEALNELCDQDLKFPLNIGFKLMKIKKEISELNGYVSSRLVLAIPNLLEDTNNLTNEQIILYNSILDTPVEIETQDLTEEELYSNSEIKISLKVIENLSPLFE